jgi:hypothetical protein
MALRNVMATLFIAVENRIKTGTAVIGGLTEPNTVTSSTSSRLTNFNIVYQEISGDTGGGRTTLFSRQRQEPDAKGRIQNNERRIPGE